MIVVSQKRFTAPEKFSNKNDKPISVNSVRNYKTKNITELFTVQILKKIKTLSLQISKNIKKNLVDLCNLRVHSFLNRMGFFSLSYIN